MSRPSTPTASLTQLKEDLAFEEALLESLQHQPNVQNQREEISRRIKLLEDKIAEMQPSLPNWGSINGSSSNGTSTPFYNTTRTGAAGLSTTLPNRKRPRNDFDDEFDALDIPGTKSFRAPTPRSGSPARSVDSFGTDFSDDPILKNLLGSNYREEKRNTEQYLRELEDRKNQEEEDAAFARSLAQEWGRDNHPVSSQPKPTVPSSSYSQSFLRPDGSWFQKPVNVKPEINMNMNKTSQQANSNFASGSSTPTSDDSGLEEISSNEWASRFGPTPSRNLPLTMNNGYPSNNNNLHIPGAFPTFSSYSSTPGASVYGNSPYSTSQYNSSTSSLNNSFNPLLNRSFGGPIRMPFDLDTYPLPSSLVFADPEQTQEEIKDLLKHIRPDEDLTPEQLAEIQPEGLKVNLMPHQRKGYAWMKSMEEGTNKGGILADDMGLGKTIQALALILGRPPDPDKDGRRLQKPTLIVAPVALMQQWERETSKMIRKSHQLNVLILHGTNRNSSWTDIKHYDIVLTTYGLLASDLKRKEKWDKHVKMIPDAKPSPQQQCPVLGEKSRFHRIFLDEAQYIKNKSTKAAVAACRIQADYRWCLSGTPMQNNVDEIHSLIKFCRIRPYCDTEKFARDIGRPLRARGVDLRRDKAMQQLQALLRAVLLRRTKKSEIDGQPIIQLPEKHTVEERAVFDKDERDFYKALETQARIQFNKFVEKNAVGQNYSRALVLLLRLRQCCCSPQLVRNAQDFLVNGAIQDVDFVENAKKLSPEVVKRLSDVDAFECPICMDAVENPVIFNPCGHSLCQECLSQIVEKAIQETEKNKVNCPHCRAEIDTSKVTDHESFLRVHFPDRAGANPSEIDVDEDDEVDTTDDDSSGDEDEDEDDDGEDLKDFIVPDEDEIRYDTDASETEKKTVKKQENNEAHSKLEAEEADTGKKKKKKSRSKDSKVKGKQKQKKSKPDTKNLAQLRAEGLRNKAAKKKYLQRLGRGYHPSAKILKTIELLTEIKNNGEGEKTIIFSSFTSFLDLLEVGLDRHGDDELTNYTRYDGSMSAKERNEAVIRFTDDPRCRSILVSLKAGNAGLNLTAANHVIILDPFWNPFVEYQAADRCYRIGQRKEVTIHRVLIGKGYEDDPAANTNATSRLESGEPEYTVEDRILALQEKKRELVETALDETASGNIGRLGVRELGYLFGVNTMDG